MTNEQDKIRGALIGGAIGDVFLTLVVILSVCSCANSETQSDTQSEKSAADTTYMPSTLTGLFYGMETDTAFNYLGKDSVLDTIPGLLHLECSDVWYNNDGFFKFDASLGVYMDSLYPSEKVRIRVTEALDTTLIIDWSYYFCRIRSAGWMKCYDFSPNQTFAQWRELFSQVTNIFKPIYAKDKYYSTYSMRICGVAHKVFQDAAQVSYIIESSVDYNGSCGCPSNAKYYTYNIETGEVLTKYQILSKWNKELLYGKLADAYKKDMKVRGSEQNEFYNGAELFKKADGVAVTNDGLLFYYVPYNLSCGADGEYFLFVR